MPGAWGGRRTSQARRTTVVPAQAETHRAIVRLRGATGPRLRGDDRLRIHGLICPDPRTRYLNAGELLDADRPARMQAAGGDADLGAEAELAAVGELRRGIVQHDGRIDLAQEFLRRRRVRGDDRVGVVRAVMLDVRDRAVDAVDHLGGDDRRRDIRSTSPPRSPASRADRPRCVASSPRTSQPASSSMATSGLRCVDAAARSTSSVSAAPQTPVRRILALSTIDFAMSSVGRLVDIDVADAFEMREHRHARLRLHAGDETLAAARHDHVDGAVETREHQPDGGAVARRHELDRGVRQAAPP